jgi:hypothetical protein
MDNGAASRAARSMRETPEPMRAAMPTSHTTTTTTVLDPTLKLLGKVDRVRRSRGGQDETSRRMHVIDSESRRPRRHYHPFFFFLHIRPTKNCMQGTAVWVWPMKGWMKK